MMNKALRSACALAMLVAGIPMEPSSFAALPPPAPTGLSAQLINGHEVHLTWSRVTVTGGTSDIKYYIKRKVFNTVWAPVRLNSSPISDISYVDSTVVQGVKYSYVVTSFLDGVESPPSQTFSVPIPAAPAASPAVVITGTGTLIENNTKISVNWNSAGVQAHYRLYRAVGMVGQTSAFHLLISDMLSTRYVDPDLVGNREYSYKVAVLNDHNSEVYMSAPFKVFVPSIQEDLAAATRLSIEPYKVDTKVGQSVTITIRAITAGSIIANRYQGDVMATASLTSEGTLYPSDVEIVKGTSSHGEFKFTVTFRKKGTYQLKPTGPHGLTGPHATFNVSEPADLSAVTHLSIEPFTVDTIVGKTESITVKAITAGNVTATKYQGPKPSLKLRGTCSLADVDIIESGGWSAGVFHLSVTFKKGGACYLEPKSGSLSGFSATFTVKNRPELKRLVITGEKRSTTPQEEQVIVDFTVVPMDEHSQRVSCIVAPCDLRIESTNPLLAVSRPSAIYDPVSKSYKFSAPFTKHESFIVTVTSISKPSVTGSVTVYPPPPPPLAPLVPPSDLTATPGDGEVILRWKGDTDPNIVYKAYRTGSGPATIRLAGSPHHDQRLQNGVKYTYVVWAERGMHRTVATSPQAAIPSAQAASLSLVVDKSSEVFGASGGPVSAKVTVRAVDAGGRMVESYQGDVSLRVSPPQGVTITSDSKRAGVFVFNVTFSPIWPLATYTFIPSVLGHPEVHSSPSSVNITVAKPLEMPQQVSAVAVNDARGFTTHVNLTWHIQNPLTGSDVNGDLTTRVFYRVKRTCTTPSAGPTEAYLGRITGTSYTDRSLPILSSNCTYAIQTVRGSQQTDFSPVTSVYIARPNYGH